MLFNDERAYALKTKINAIVQPPILAFPKITVPFYVFNDISKDEIKAALNQSYLGGERKPFGFWSSLLNRHKRIYPTTEKDCLLFV